MKTPDPRGFPRASALARLSEEKPQLHYAHWSFDPQRATHKACGLHNKLLRSIRETAIELGMVTTVACLDKPLRGSLKAQTARARRIAILNNL